MPSVHSLSISLPLLHGSPPQDLVALSDSVLSILTILWVGWVTGLLRVAGRGAGGSRMAALMCLGLCSLLAAGWGVSFLIHVTSFSSIVSSEMWRRQKQKLQGLQRLRFSGLSGWRFVRLHPLGQSKSQGQPRGGEGKQTPSPMGGVHRDTERTSRVGGIPGASFGKSPPCLPRQNSLRLHSWCAKPDANC